MVIIKKIIKKIFNALGYELVSLRSKEDDDKRFTDIYKKLYSAKALSEKRFYNVGSGSFHHKYWTNLDYVSDWYKDGQKEVIHIDLMQMTPLPIESEKAEVIYTSHTIEHVKEEAVKYLFKEVYRCLKPGGFFRVTTGPDADLDFEALKRGDEYWFYWDYWYEKPGTYEQLFHQPATSVPIEERWLHHVASQLAPNSKTQSKIKINATQLKELMKTMTKEQLLDHLTSLCVYDPKRPGDHVSWWNVEKVINYLKEAGFKTVYRSGYGQSACPILRDTKYFDNTHPQISLYVEAVK
ncbi:MAG: class I SAM-dependent methyltransferase [Cytophagaceae bacterium]|nr:class I SAM-dependent methyltransferase [Cytophagaceae bacterium]MDW8456675.1 methyltransferase domain-containing protein [Cytophagaceae bacterium]